MKRSAHSRSIALRSLGALLLVALLGGCVSYYERHVGEPGVYYGGGYESVYYRPAPRPLNPVYYPYWSLDYFYFDRFYHPYSVYVGYREPLYYPYPGWVFGARYYGGGYHGSLGFGYPWHGYGHFYPRYSLGFFAPRYHYAGHVHHRPEHRIRHIDRRLRALSEPATAPSRAALVGRGRDSGIPINGSRYDARSRSAGTPSRAALLRSGGGSRASIDRSGAASARADESRYRNAASLDRRRVLQSRSDSASGTRGRSSSAGSRADWQRGSPSIRRAPESGRDRAGRTNSMRSQRREAEPPRGRSEIRSGTRSEIRSDSRSAPPTRGRSAERTLRSRQQAARRGHSTQTHSSDRGRLRAAPSVRSGSSIRGDAAPSRRSSPSPRARVDSGPRRRIEPRSRSGSRERARASMSRRDRGRSGAASSRLRDRRDRGRD